MKPRLYSIWHLNLMYSSIEIDRRAEVIAKCFWPLIDLAKKGFRPGIEAPGLTLEIAQELDPKWIQELKSCWEQGLLEFVGSGYSQVIGSLVPAKLNQINIQEGIAAYKKILGRSPDLWMANEQTYSKGLAESLLDEGIQNLVIDWNNPYGNHLEWQDQWAFSTQTTLDTQGRSMNIVWSDSLAFQRFQRYVHQENVAAEYHGFLNSLFKKMTKNPGPNSFCIYGNDAEIFDFRPGRFATEPSLENSQEWPRIFEIFGLMQEMGFEFCRPSHSLTENRPQTNPLEITNLVEPSSVKKQPKYNVTRWSLSGRSSAKSNQMCFDLLESSFMTTPDSRRKICFLWSSDFRTHITEKRWIDFFRELTELHTKYVKPSSPNLSGQVEKNETTMDHPAQDKLIFETDHLQVELNPLRGLSLEKIQLKNKAAFLGRLCLGSFSHMDLSADWYSGNVVLQLPGQAQITDLKKSPTRACESDTERYFQTKMAFNTGFIHKTLRFPKDRAEWTEEFHFQIPQLSVGSLRFGFITLATPLMMEDGIQLRTHLGGKTMETWPLPNVDFDHGQQASSLVSATQGLGMTEGQIQILTKDQVLTVSLEHSTLRPLAMIENKIDREGRFFRLYFSVSEYDETRRGPFDLTNETVRFRYQLEKRP